MSALARFELRWARAALEAIFPTNACASLPQGIGEFDIEGYLTDAVRRIPREAVLGLRVAIWIVALAPLWVLGRASTIASLAVPDRERVLRSLLASPFYFVRQLVLLLKQMGAFLYAGAASVRARVLLEP